MSDWRRRAQCRIEKADPNLFADKIHRESATARDARHEKAAEFCARCPVRDECLAEGKANGEEGIWGQQLMKVRATGPKREREKLILTPQQRKERRNEKDRVPVNCPECGRELRAHSLPTHLRNQHKAAS